jgi:hypothetical protein
MAEDLPKYPTQAELDPIRQRLLSIQKELETEPDLDRRMRSILGVTSLPTQLAGPEQAVDSIKAAARRKPGFRGRA